MPSRRQITQDALYGPVVFDGDMMKLAATPMVQRLRHVRLSNIDSIDMPGIANLSRYEHVLGVCHLASQVQFRKNLTKYDWIVLKASALLHDWAITSFGHLVEEALQYVGTGFDHEQRLREIVSRETPDEIGGVQRQILAGREAGLGTWARSVAGSDAERLIADVTDHVHGQGRMGRVISGGIDLDNIDNVFRMAFHMGLSVDRETPLRLARGTVSVDDRCGEPIFSRAVADDIHLWRATRSDVYQHLMLAPRDFAGKLLILFSTIRAFEEAEFTKVDWSLTDDQLMGRLIESKTQDVSETAKRWISGELWDITPLVWMRGDRPAYSRLLEFSRALSEHLDRNCFAYGIKDKRERRLAVQFDQGGCVN